MNDVLIALLLVSVVAPLGCVFFFALAKRGFSSKQIIYMNLFLFILIPIYGMLGLKEQWEFYVLSGVFGFATGALASFTRSLFSSLIPAGHEGEYFSLYELTDKGTAWLGPLALGIVSNVTGSFRKGFFTVVIFFVVGGSLLTRLNVKMGMQERDLFEEKERKKQVDGPLAAAMKSFKQTK